MAPLSNCSPCWSSEASPRSRRWCRVPVSSTTPTHTARSVYNRSLSVRACLICASFTVRCSARRNVNRRSFSFPYRKLSKTLTFSSEDTKANREYQSQWTFRLMNICLFKGLTEVTYSLFYLLTSLLLFFYYFQFSKLFVSKTPSWHLTVPHVYHTLNSSNNDGQLFFLKRTEFLK